MVHKGITPKISAGVQPSGFPHPPFITPKIYAAFPLGKDSSNYSNMFPRNF